MLFFFALFVSLDIFRILVFGFFVEKKIKLFFFSSLIDFVPSFFGNKVGVLFDGRKVRKEQNERKQECRKENVEREKNKEERERKGGERERVRERNDVVAEMAKDLCLQRRNYRKRFGKRCTDEGRQENVLL